jgi:hypothetical protein
MNAIFKRPFLAGSVKDQIFFFLSPFSGRFPLPLPSFHKQREVVFSLGDIKFRASPRGFLKGKNDLQWHRNVHINLLNAVAKPHMVSVSACRMPMAARYWQAAVQRGVIN